ncbi:DUF397 domain-containing protein [Streptomyces sp. NBC_01136]|uniref:DUF397 domain-containing protein n=1 Tax=unclassified Streptomyces TaxID=2593676 RepID=UPI003255819A|nr:DUF397 domain-containing protein [Streptomyces sp. NBC_01136]
MNTRLTAPDVAAEHLWKKSSHSDSQGGACVEIADLTAHVGIRDSKDKRGPALLVTDATWSSFITGVKTDEES